MSKNQRRIKQRIRQRVVRDLELAQKRKQELEATLSNMGPKFYDPKFLKDDSSLGTCSVCGKCTRAESGFLTMCSKECQEEYMRQWEQFGLNLGMGANILFDGQKLKFLTWMLKKNSEGEPCLRAYDPELEDEYNKAPEILVPLSARQRIKQFSPH